MVLVKVLLRVDGDRQWEMVDGVFIVKPTSMHLAQFLTEQTPRCGH